MWNWTLQAENKPQDGFPWEEPHTETSWSSDSNLVVAGGRGPWVQPAEKGAPESSSPVCVCGRSAAGVTPLVTTQATRRIAVG